MSNQEITAKSTLAEVLNHPNGKVALEKFEVPCLFCPMAAMEMNELQIGQICEMYGIELKNLLEEINT
jgi:hypothetical protein